MHELGIAQGILDRAREVALENGAARVTDLHVALTPAADFTEDALSMYFELLTGEDDFFRGVRLHFERQSSIARCLDCGQEFATDRSQACCPQCSSLAVVFEPGAPMVRLTGIDVEDEHVDGEGGGA